MNFQRTCGSCQNNFGGFCTAKGFGQAIESEESSCELWEISEELLADVMDDAPWYLKRPYENGKLSLNEFLERMEEDLAGRPVEINLYDAIEEIYELSQQQIAEVLGVSSDVVGYARAKGTVKRRIPHFAKCLCIPEELFQICTTADLGVLIDSCIEYRRQNEKPEFPY